MRALRQVIEDAQFQRGKESLHTTSRHKLLDSGGMMLYRASWPQPAPTFIPDLLSASATLGILERACQKTQRFQTIMILTHNGPFWGGGGGRVWIWVNYWLNCKTFSPLSGRLSGPPYAHNSKMLANERRSLHMFALSSSQMSIRVGSWEGEFNKFPASFLCLGTAVHIGVLRSHEPIGQAVEVDILASTS